MDNVMITGTDKKDNGFKKLAVDVLDLYTIILNPQGTYTEQDHSTHIFTKQVQILPVAMKVVKNVTMIWRLIGIYPHREWTNEQLISGTPAMADAFVAYPELRIPIIDLLLYKQPLPEVKLKRDFVVEWESVKEWAKRCLSESSSEQTSKTGNTKMLAQTEAAHALLQLGHVEGGDTQSSAGKPAGEPAPKRQKA